MFPYVAYRTNSKPQLNYKADDGEFTIKFRCPALKKLCTNYMYFMIG